MAETVDEAVDLAEVQPPTTGLCLCEQYVRVTEGGALTAARWLGRADQEAAEGDAAAAMRAVLDDFPIRGRVVIGSAMEVSPLRAIDDIRASADRINVVQDRTVTASISAAIRGTNDHLAVGIGGTRQAIMSAAALRCLGGELQAQLWPTSRREIEEAHELGIEDPTRVFTTEEPAPGEVIVVATGVSNGYLLRGVRFLTDSARTHSIVMCTRCNWVRFIDGVHFFARERREEVRLLGY